MIDLNKYLNTEFIIPNLKASTREEAIMELVDKLFEDPLLKDSPVTKDDVYKDVMFREKLQTTGIGKGLAFPHARIEDWGEFKMAMGVSHKGIDFESPDKNAVRIIFLMISSPKEPYIVLQTMSAIVRFMNEQGVEEEESIDLEKAMDILEIFKTRDLEATEHILASDIARPIMEIVTVDTSLEEATRKMHLKKQDVLAVVDGEGHFMGEISCRDIFEYGMPDFFKQLNTISFVKYVDPFEKYFRIKKNLKVKDIYNANCVGMKKDSTLLEIIFEMTVKRKNKIFVIDDDGKLVGIIDRFCVIDKILFF